MAVTQVLAHKVSAKANVGFTTMMHLKLRILTIHGAGRGERKKEEEKGERERNEARLFDIVNSYLRPHVALL